MLNRKRLMLGFSAALVAGAVTLLVSDRTPATAGPAPISGSCYCEALGQWTGTSAGQCACDATFGNVVNTDGLCLPEPLCSPSGQCTTEATLSFNDPGGFPPAACANQSIPLSLKVPCDGDSHVTARCPGGTTGYTLTMFCTTCTPG